MATLPSSGALSISAINAEFGRGNNLNSYRGTTWYTDAGGSGTFSSGAIAMSEFYSKRATSPAPTYSNPLGFNNQTFTTTTGQGATAVVTLEIFTDGQWKISSGFVLTSNWVSPTTTGIGTGKYVKFTLNSTTGTGGTWTTTTGWLEITATQIITVTQTPGTAGAQRTRSTNYTVQIATDSAGTNIVCAGTCTLNATASGVVP